MTGFNSKRDAAADKDALFEKFEVAQPAQKPELEVLKLALEALKSMKKTLAEHDEPTTFNEDEAIASVEAALAQPAQEPVAFDEFLESQDFYELMQTYRHCPIDAHIPFETVKDALRAVHIKAALVQPVQEPTWFGYDCSGWALDRAVVVKRELNFCERCGKRTADLTVIHTCTPPQEKNL
jgi:hypothetical protein